MPWVSIWYMSRYLRYVPLYGHRKRFCHKFMFISNNRVQTQHFQNGVLKPYGTNWKHYYQGFHNANVCLFRKQCVFWWWGRLQFQPCNNLFFFFSKLSDFVFLFCIKTGEWHFPGMYLCSLIIMMPDNGLDSIGAGASSRHNIDEILQGYSHLNRGTKLISLSKILFEWMKCCKVDK